MGSYYGDFLVNRRFRRCRIICVQRRRQFQWVHVRHVLGRHVVQGLLDASYVFVRAICLALLN